MSDMTQKIKQVVSVGANTIARAASCGAKTVARFASSAVKTAKFKLDELGTNSKRRDLFNELGKQVYELAKAGEELPLAVTSLTQQIQELDKSLEQLRADHAAQKAEAAATRVAEKEARNAAKATVQTPIGEDVMPQTEEPSCVCEATADPVETADDQPDVPTLNV